MNKFSEMTAAQRRLVLEQCKNRLGLPEQAVEKDYWVTVVLQLLFDSELSGSIIFKGGTSLSKCGVLIDRFSEDIDLAVDPRLFGQEGDPTKKQLKKLRKASSLFVKESLSTILAAQIDRYGLSDHLQIVVEPDGEGDLTYPEPRHLYVRYRSILPQTLAYIKPEVVLETGARSLMEPTVSLRLQTLISQTFGEIDTTICDVPVITASPEKTFIEKVFLLHELFCVERDFLPAGRRSRHLYDLYKMMDRDFAIKAITDDALWESVRHHREVFTSMLGVDYSCDIRDNLCLLPPEPFIEDWQNDYRLMCDAMIYGDKPTWPQLLESLRQLESHFRDRLSLK